MLQQAVKEPIVLDRVIESHQYWDVRQTFLVNPAAGAGRAEVRLRRVLSHHPELSSAAIVRIRSVAEASRAVSVLASGALPVAVGGDGTIAMVATALLNTCPDDHVLGMLPLGTGNILAYALGFRRVEQALAGLQHGPTGRIDVLRTSDPAVPVAVVSISTGFEARFIRRYERLRRFGRVAGALAGLTTMAHRSSGIALEIDEIALVQSREAIFSAGLYNTPYYAGGLMMSPGAQLADGKAEAIVYQTLLDYWRTVMARARGQTEGRARVLRRSWRSARMSSDHGFQIDGEFRALLQIDVHVEPCCLTVKLPPSTHAELPAAQVGSRERASEV